MTHILLHVQRNAPRRPTTRLLRDMEAEPQVTGPEGQVEWAPGQKDEGTLSLAWSESCLHSLWWHYLE